VNEAKRHVARYDWAKITYIYICKLCEHMRQYEILGRRRHLTDRISRRMGEGEIEREGTASVVTRYSEARTLIDDSLHF